MRLPRRSIAAGDDQGEAAADDAAGGGNDLQAGFGPGWLRRELAAAATWRAVLHEGWASLQLASVVDAEAAPPEVAEALGLARTTGIGGGPTRGGSADDDAGSWAAALQLAFLTGLSRALAGSGDGHEPDEAGVLTGIR